jgi:hypothetical protein
MLHHSGYPSSVSIQKERGRERERAREIEREKEREKGRERAVTDTRYAPSPWIHPHPIPSCDTEKVSEPRHSWAVHGSLGPTRPASHRDNCDRVSRFRPKSPSVRLGGNGRWGVFGWLLMVSARGPPGIAKNCEP